MSKVTFRNTDELLSGKTGNTLPDFKHTPPPPRKEANITVYVSKKDESNISLKEIESVKLCFLNVLNKDKWSVESGLSDSFVKSIQRDKLIAYDMHINKIDQTDTVQRDWSEANVDEFLKTQ